MKKTAGAVCYFTKKGDGVYSIFAFADKSQSHAQLHKLSQMYENACLSYSEAYWQYSSICFFRTQKAGKESLISKNLSGLCESVRKCYENRF